MAVNFDYSGVSPDMRESEKYLLQAKITKKIENLMSNINFNIETWFMVHGNFYKFIIYPFINGNCVMIEFQYVIDDKILLITMESYERMLKAVTENFWNHPYKHIYDFCANCPKMTLENAIQFIDMMYKIDGNKF